MFRLRLLSFTSVLVFGIAISLSQSHDGEILFSKLAKPTTTNQRNPSVHTSLSAQRSSRNGPLTTKPSTGKQHQLSSRALGLNDTLKSQTSDAQKRQYGDGWGWGGGQGHGWGGWGWHPHQQHYYQPSYGGNDNKLLILGALAGLGLLAALGFFMFNRNNPNSVVFVNSSGRRRRAVADFDDNLEGETITDLVSRVTGFIESAWTGSSGGKQLELFQLPHLD